VTLRLREAGLNCYSYSDLGAVARHLVTASWFIGNDSGLGQLASNVGTPTITLFALPRRVGRWQPCWAPATAVLPDLSGKIPELFRHIIWKHWITPEGVLAAFQNFRKTVLKDKKG
jgi:heptosyltransferase-3